MSSRISIPAAGLLLLIVLGLAAGCASTRPQVKPAEELLAQGEEYWQKKKWEDAAEIYGKIRDYYPYHTQAGLAQFRAAEALYKDKKYPEALAAFEVYQELHPNDPQMPHIMLRIGLCHFNMMVSVDRDQVEAEEAAKAFDRLIKRFPKAKEAEDAEKRLKLAYIRLIQHELYVARYYQKTGAYKAAVGRYQRALTYPDVGYRPLVTAELTIAEALAEGKKPPKIDVPPPPKEAEETFWEKLKLWE